MNDEHKVLVIPAVADRDAGGSWVAEVADPASPFAGLFAWGDSFTTARAGLAEVAWAALSGGAEGFEHAGVDPAAVAAVRIVATTRKTFPVARLAGGAA